ncbi:MAG: type II secretion system protein GspD, partial [Planctomycetota bacterium]
APPAEKPKGVVVLKELHHKTADEFLRFARDLFPEWVEKGHVERIEGKGRSVLVRGETPAAEDALAKKILEVIGDFDDLELKVESRKIRPRYVNLATVIDALTMRGIANVWKVTEATNVATWKVGDKQMTASSKNLVYAQTGLVPGAVAPIPVPPRIPYVYELVSSDPFPMPLVYGGANNVNQPLVDFRNTTSTEERGVLMAVGTPADLEAIQAFVDEIDKPARQILIEVEVIQLEASKLTDFGIDSLQFGERHTIGNVALNLPDEAIVQPGMSAVRKPGVYVPPITEEGFSLLFDDSTQDLAGRFIANLHALVRTGEAQYRARPKILTLDDRVSVLHIGENVPVFKSTGVTRDATVGSFVSEVRNVDAIYVGFTLNIRPRVSGGAEDEVSLNIEVSVNELGERQRVFAEDLLGIPNIFKRQYVGQNRVKNHRPIVLGGLIAEKEGESVNKIPLLGDIPYLGMAFRRTVKTSQREEVIFVLTPHILSEKGWDRFAAPKESSLFDTYDSVLFNDSHIIKGRDVIGIDPISGTPARMEDGKIFTEEEVLDLTLLNIVKVRELVSKLGIIQGYLPDASKQLNWVQRRWPEATVRNWPDDKKEIFYRAAAIVIENIKELNPDLTYEEIVVPRRQIILPTTPYRISLSYDRVKALERGGTEYVFRARNELSEKTIELLRESSVRNLRQFADFLESRRRAAEDHGDMIVELKELFASQKPLESGELEGISYPDVYRKLGEAGFDFLSLATYFGARKRDRADYNPNVANFESDLRDFLAVSLSLPERARWLKQLEDRWERLTAAKSSETFRAEDGAEGGGR